MAEKSKILINTEYAMKQIIFCFIISLIFIACQKNEGSMPIIHKDLLRMDSANAQNDAYQAIKNKDFRFVGIYGYSVQIPGIEKEYYWHIKDSVGLKMINGTSDAITSKEQGRLQNIAIGYAKEYNSLLFEYLMKNNLLPKL
jgi:hypothetical protein